MQTVWINGGFVPSDKAIDASDRGFLLGDGLFDTALAINGVVFRGKQHVARLTAALELLEIPVDTAEIEAAMTALAERQVDGSIRLTVTRGPGVRGLKLPPEPTPLLLGSRAPLTPSLMFAPIRCALADVRRNETSPLSRIKTVGYLDAILASRKAEREGASEALFLNSKGAVACSSLGNLFVAEGMDLATPPLKDGVLPGITRGWVIEHAEDFGLRPIERSVAPKSLNLAEGLFLTNSLRLITPMTLSGKADSADIPEAVQQLMVGLCEAIARECGKDPRDLGAKLPG